MGIDDNFTQVTLKKQILPIMANFFSHLSPRPITYTDTCINVHLKGECIALKLINTYRYALNPKFQIRLMVVSE